MGSKKTKTTSQETATTTPNIYGGAQGPVSNYFGGIQDFQNGNMANWVTPANATQQGAWAMGSQFLNPDMSNFNFASDLTKGIARAALTPNYMGTAQAQAPGMNMARLDDAVTSALPGAYNTANVNLPGQYDVARAGTAQFGNVAQAGVANMPNLGQFMIGQHDIGPAQQASAGVGYANIDRYMDPARDQVINASMADFDEYAGQQQANMLAQAELNRGFGGSGYYIGQGQLEGELARARNTQHSGLLSDMFRTALQYSSNDANNVTQAGIANMQSANNLATAQAQLNQSGDMFNMGMLADFGMAGFNAQNNASQFNAGQWNDIQSQIFGATNSNNQFNAGAQNNANAQFYGAGADAASQNASAQNNANSQFWTGALNNNQFNAGQQNQFGLANFDAMNNANNLQYSTQAGLNQFNAGQANQMTQANANNWLSQLGLGLNAGQTLADLSTQGQAYQANGANQALALGNSQYANDAQTSPLAQLLMQQGLLDPSLIAALSGQTINSTGNSTSKQSGGTLGAFLQAASQAASAAAMASERRVKRDIVKLGEESDGLGVYSYNYIWDEPDEPTRTGVMVDEVERIRPWALGPVVDGVQTVNYGAL